MVVVDRWLLIGGEDGRIALWATDPVALVREIDLGAPVRSVAAEPGLAAARDAHGRLWTFNLDPYPGVDEPGIYGSVDVSKQSLDLVGEGEYEVTAIRVSSGGVPMPVRVVGWWPEMDSCGELVVPIWPLPDQPIRLVREPLGTEWPRADGGRSGFEVEVDVVSRGYRTTVRPYISWRSFSR